MGAEQLQAIIDHRHDRSAQRPRSDQRANREKDEDGRQPCRNAVQRRVADARPRHPVLDGDAGRDQRAKHQRDLVRALRRLVAVEQV